jgi:FlaA1/EpsC-like NDP-sugar epimerase
LVNIQDEGRLIEGGGGGSLKSENCRGVIKFLHSKQGEKIVVLERKKWNCEKLDISVNTLFTTVTFPKSMQVQKRSTKQFSQEKNNFLT